MSIYAPCGFDTCFVCGSEWPAGLGYWAVHTDTDVTLVCRGKCWREYSAAKSELKALGFWESLCPEITPPTKDSGGGR